MNDVNNPVARDGEDLSARDLSRLAADVLSVTPFPALVLEVRSQRIVASSPAATRLLDPDSGAVVGHLLEEFTADRPALGVDLLAGGRLNGFEAFRVLRRAQGVDLKVRMWIRTFDHQPPSRYVLVVIVADQLLATSAPPETDQDNAPAVVGTADSRLLIERISGDAEGLFGRPVTDLLGRSLMSLVALDDVPSILAALSEASASANGVALYVDVATEEAGSATVSSLGCEVLILPLEPTPSCAFVFLPTPAGMPRAHISRDLSAILSRLGRGAEVAQLVRGVFGGITEHDLPGLSRLTTRELEIVMRLLDGDRPPAIAARLFLSQSTVRNHLASVFAKLGVGSQQEIVDLFRAVRPDGEGR